VKGIEPSLSAWEADVLPLNYTRERDPLYLLPRTGAATPPGATRIRSTSASPFVHRNKLKI
jgi:hypothetical protein